MIRCVLRIFAIFVHFKIRCQIQLTSFLIQAFGIVVRFQLGIVNPHGTVYLCRQQIYISTKVMPDLPGSSIHLYMIRIVVGTDGSFLFDCRELSFVALKYLGVLDVGELKIALTFGESQIPQRKFSEFSEACVVHLQAMEFVILIHDQ